MEVGEYLLSVDTVSKFYNSLHVSGWFHHGINILTKVELSDDHSISCVGNVGLPHGGVERDLGPRKGFAIQTLRSTDRPLNLEAIRLNFGVSDGNKISLPLSTLVTDRLLTSPAFELSRDFVEMVQASAGAKLLDVGGRDRSRIDRSKYFHGVETVVLDILAGDNVDVIGDAHEMSRLFPGDHFDFVYSVSVFEHLAMPWKVVCEMNRVMKPGAFGLVHSHQSIGIHDAPWDFYRFSDRAWAGLFNKQTGFEVIASVMDHPQYLIPFLFRDGKEDAERSAGFESSTVMFRKTGPCKVSWDVPLRDVIDTSYPQI